MATMTTDTISWWNTTDTQWKDIVRYEMGENSFIKQFMCEWGPEAEKVVSGVFQQANQTTSHSYRYQTPVQYKLTYQPEASIEHIYVSIVVATKAEYEEHVLSRVYRGQRYYCADVKKPIKVIWSKNPDDALLFSSKQEAMEFLHSYIPESKHNDVELIRDRDIED